MCPLFVALHPSKRYSACCLTLSSISIYTCPTALRTSRLQIHNVAVSVRTQTQSLIQLQKEQFRWLYPENAAARTRTPSAFYWRVQRGAPIGRPSLYRTLLRALKMLFAVLPPVAYHSCTPSSVVKYILNEIICVARRMEVLGHLKALS